MKVENNVTDQGGTLKSAWFEVDPNKKLTIERKVIVHYANQYSYPNMGIFLDQATEFTTYVIHANYAYASGGYCARFGTYISRNNANAFRYEDEADVSDRIEPIWDQWFDEKVVYDPFTGSLEYFMNDQSKLLYNIGILPDLDTYLIYLQFSAAG